MDRTIRGEDDGRGLNPRLCRREHQRRKRKERHPPLLREIGFAEISFIVLAEEFHERVPCTSVTQKIIVSMTRN